MMCSRQCSSSSAPDSSEKAVVSRYRCNAASWHRSVSGTGDRISFARSWIAVSSICGPKQIASSRHNVVPFCLASKSRTGRREDSVCGRAWNPESRTRPGSDSRRALPTPAYRSKAQLDGRNFLSRCPIETLIML
ncbi:hypothetical protein PHSY_001358 [Pseudozyma hubeiensis SY62]|uniref:Uncharacterized protein n=1 Tax=Pseudozyma hubeiensis (strain SY62) TaxID=1305764 RepID=R9NYE6_PSEHS|nr:hypothetical protein PHSY_001358 [Pseudozyma hubeiensis SY62]GAC93793.1 hypothetical protein PHSY_001358 [Pseudozyma hubeiensis SY62]